MNKFVWQQLLSNSDGKTSASGTAGILCILVGLVCFSFGVEEVWRQGRTDTMTQSIMVITIGAGLLGYRKSHDGKLAGTVAKEEAEAPTENINEEDNPKI